MVLDLIQHTVMILKECERDLVASTEADSRKAYIRIMNLRKNLESQYSSLGQQQAMAMVANREIDLHTELENAAKELLTWNENRTL